MIRHSHYSNREAGFWIHKSLEQWKIENPNALAALDVKSGPPSTGGKGRVRFWTTQRFVTDSIQHDYAHAITREEVTLRDAETNQVMARSINYWRGRSANVFEIGGSVEELRQALTLGWGNRECGDPSPTEEMRRLRYDIEQLGGRK